MGAEPPFWPKGSVPSKADAVSPGDRVSSGPEGADGRFDGPSVLG